LLRFEEALIGEGLERAVSSSLGLARVEIPPTAFSRRSSPFSPREYPG
jgi:hypothetical protein